MTDELKRRHSDPALARTHTVSTRLNADELNRLDLMRGEFRRGEYLRAVFMNNEPFQIPEVNRQSWVELARSASNLNQLAHHLNTNGLSSDDVAEVRQLLADFRANLLGVNFLNSGGCDERDAED